MDPDAEVGLVRSEGQGDVGDEGAQQPLAVAVRGRRCGPQAREVAGERFDVGARRRRGLTGLAGEFGVGVGELAEFGFPAGLEAARDGGVGVALVKRAFGAGGVIAGSFGAQLDGAGRAAAAVGDRVAAVSASVIWSGATAASSRSATACSTRSPMTPRQPGVPTRSMRL